MLCGCAVDDVIESEIIKNRNVTRDFLDRRPLLFICHRCGFGFDLTTDYRLQYDHDCDQSNLRGYIEGFGYEELQQYFPHY